MNGVCIVFHKEYLTHNLSVTCEELLQDDVTYMSHREVDKKQPGVFELPFIKRLAYKDEHEYRIVRMFNEEEAETPARDYDIDLGCIERIVLSPWLPRRLGASIQRVLTSIDGCEKLKVTGSALIADEKWDKFGNEVYRQQKEMEESDFFS